MRRLSRRRRGGLIHQDVPDDFEAVSMSPDDDEAEDFPFTKPGGSDASMFIQWKGTDVCLDFHCPCGASSHLDDDFAYNVRCPACGSVFQMGTQVIARRVPGNDTRGAIVRDLDAD